MLFERSGGGLKKKSYVEKNREKMQKKRRTKFERSGGELKKRVK